MKKTVYLFFALLCIGIHAQINGVLILNEGGAGSNNAEVSLIDNQSNVTNNYFSNNNNNAILGDTAQDIKIYGDKIFIVLNISNQIKVINKSDFSLITTITDQVRNPRYIAFKDNKAYVTNWGSNNTTLNYVAVYDIDNYSHQQNISVGNGPEKIFYKNNKFYTLLKGGYSSNQFVDVINVQNNVVEQQINVGNVPHSIFEKNDLLYIMSSGDPYASNSFGTLTIFDTNSHSINSSLTFPAGSKPSYMDTDGTNIYYMIGASIYKTPISTPSISSSPLVTTPITGWGGAYGFNIVNNTIYVADPQGYIAQGKVLSYDLQGNFLQTYNVGYLPNQIIAYDSNSSLAINEVKKSQKIILYPNPTTDKFFIKGMNDAKIQIMDMSGRLVLQEIYTEKGIQTHTLPKGTYLVNVNNGKSQWIEKLIIK